ncbi:transposase [Serratia sp. IR-2025]
MADNSMTFSNTLMQLGSEDFLRELTEFMLNRIWKLTSPSASTRSLMNAVTSARPTATATIARQYNTRLGTLDLRIPKLREGSYLPPSSRPADCRRRRSTRLSRKRG